ncbi:chemotaxis protein CheW [Rugamonas sp. FT107W]|uniref:Chemotaxis protein CheW n=1 Tax=Duganella vulcania TaxID=2692166 RepID=A0A845HBS4_9BURK|nr:chemotaxis protein CheW [Duganella vulcania]MYN16572.1 chemotaxis protein CheW [Duganella vulcania]
MSGPTPDTPSTPAGPERRSRLRQYQVQLLERMQAAKTGAAAGGRELGVLIGGRLCLLDLTQISEIVPLQPVTPVPLAQDWYQGLANIRGNLTGVIDLARYQGLAAGDAAAERRLITFAPTLGFNCALLAERVLGLRKLADMRALEAPADAGPEWSRQHYTDGEGQQWTRIDLAQLVREPRFLQVGL